MFKMLLKALVTLGILQKAWHKGDKRVSEKDDICHFHHMLFMELMLNLYILMN